MGLHWCAIIVQILNEQGTPVIGFPYQSHLVPMHGQQLARNPTEAGGDCVQLDLLECAILQRVHHVIRAQEAQRHIGLEIIERRRWIINFDIFPVSTALRLFIKASKSYSNQIKAFA